MKLKQLLRRDCIPFLLLSLVVPISASAQSRTVSGKIVGADKAPLAGASVQLKGTKTGTTSDNAGNFSLTVPNNNAILTISSAGFATQDITVGDQTSINVQLIESVDKLSEVVVVGYGTQKRKEVTSAVATVNAAQFNKGNISDVSQLLQGKVAGLSISRPGGNPNGGFTLRLRGLSTLGANSSPLVVVDGQVGADINTVDPNDIQSFDILKDAASGAIYGTRASSGVIIITTKRGGRTPVVSYNGSVTT